MKKKSMHVLLFTVLILVVLAAGCGREENKLIAIDDKGANQNNPISSVNPPAPPKPVTLQLASQSAAAILDGEFQEILQKHIKNKYPHITLNFNPEATGTYLTELIAAGQTPDVVVTFNGNLASYRDLDLVLYRIFE